MKNIRIILVCLIIAKSVSSQEIIVDSSFGINGRITYSELQDFFGSYHLNIDGNRNILVNKFNKFLYVDSTGELLNIFPYSNPFNYTLSNQVFAIDYVKITPKNDAYISYVQFNATFRYFIKKLNLDNFQDSTFGNSGILMIGKKPDVPLNVGQNSLGQLIVLQSIPNYPKNQNSIKMSLFNTKGIVDSILFKLPNCKDTAQIFSSNVAYDSNGNIIFGYSDFCNDTLKTTLIRIKSDLSIDKLFAQNGYLPISEILKLNASNAIISILVGKDDEIYVFLEDDKKNVKIVKVLKNGLIDMNFGLKGIVQIDNYRFQFGNEPIYDRDDNTIQMFLYNNLESKSKLFGINTDGQFIPNYNINDGLFFLSNINEFKPVGNQSYYAINIFDNPSDNTFQLIKFKKNTLLSSKDLLNTSFNFKYKLLYGELQIENSEHRINSIQIYNLMGQEISTHNSLESNSVIRIKFESSSHQMILVKVADDHGLTQSFKIML